MTMIERFSTPFNSARANLNFWNEVAGENWPGLNVDSNVGDFAAELHRWRLDGFTLLWPHSAVSRVQAPRRDGAERLLVHIQGRGESLQRHRGHEILLRPGDLSVCSSADLSDLQATSHDMIVLDLPRADILALVPDLDDRLGTLVSSRLPGVNGLRQFVSVTWQDAMRSGAQQGAEWQAGFRSILCRMVALALSGRPEPGVRTPGDRLFALVEARLHDPELSAETLALECNVSVRTVQLWFGGMGTTPRAFIKQRRLARAADRLRTMPQDSVTRIAFDHGFNDSAHFTRCFTQQFGVSPSRWREGHSVAVSH